MTSKINDPNEEYIEIAEECHVLLENISEFFSGDLLAVEGDIDSGMVSQITVFRDKLQAVLSSPIR